MRVYISGGITHDPDYKRKFRQRADFLTKAGYEVVNPVAISEHLDLVKGKDNVSYEDYMKADIKALLDCDAISTLPGWEKSKGAKLEQHIAAVLKLGYVDVKVSS